MSVPPPPPPPVAGHVEVSSEGFHAVDPKKWKQREIEKKAEKLKELEVPLTESAIFDVSKSASLERLDWDNACAFKTSSGGSAGVFFVEFKRDDGKHVKCVVKGSPETAREVFVARLARSLGISCPHVRVIPYCDIEFKDLQQVISKLAQGEDRHKASKNLNRPQILIMEFVDGISLYELNKDLVEKYFNAKSELSKDVLCTLGKVLALDCFLNNFDRVPLIHNNEGNYANVMLQDNGKIIAIDNAMYPIAKMVSGKENTQHGKYLEKLEELLSQLKKCGHSEEAPLITSLREKMLTGCGVPLGKEEGKRSGCRNAKIFQ